MNKFVIDMKLRKNFKLFLKSLALKLLLDKICNKNIRLISPKYKENKAKMYFAD